MWPRTGSSSSSTFSDCIQCKVAKKTLTSQEGLCPMVLLSFIFAIISMDNFLTVQSPGTFRYIFRKNKYYSEEIRRYMFAFLALICQNIKRAVLLPLSSSPPNGERERKKSSEHRHRGRHFTCGNYLKDRGRNQGADSILSPAGQRALVQFRHRGVLQDAHGAIASGSEPLRRDLQGLRRVVELHLKLRTGESVFTSQAMSRLSAREASTTRIRS